MATDNLSVEVVSATGIVWMGDAVAVIARTTEGDIGILPGHEPVLAVLVPCALEVMATDTDREIIAVDGGFISVSENHVSIISQHSELAKTVSLREAELAYASAKKDLDEGTVTEEIQHRYDRALSQLLAARKQDSNRTV